MVLPGQVSPPSGKASSHLQAAHPAACEPQPPHRACLRHHVAGVLLDAPGFQARLARGPGIWGAMSWKSCCQSWQCPADGGLQAWAGQRRSHLEVQSGQETFLDLDMKKGTWVPRSGVSAVGARDPDREGCASFPGASLCAGAWVLGCMGTDQIHPRVSVSRAGPCTCAACVFCVMVPSPALELALAPVQPQGLGAAGET